MEKSVIQPATPEDLERLVALERLCHAHPWSAESFRQELENPWSRLDLARIGGDLAGYVCSRQVADELEILNVAVGAPWRRRGVAAELLRHVLRRALAGGAEKAFLEVRAGNEGAIALYRSFHFRQIGRRLRYYDDGEDALLMELALAGFPSGRPDGCRAQSA